MGLLLSCSFAFVYIANLCLDLEMRLMPGFRFLGIVRRLGPECVPQKGQFFRELYWKFVREFYREFF